MGLNTKHNNCLYILITSLFYPAILGALFYFLFEDFSLIATDTTKFVYVIASLGIIISFSVDYLYTYAHKSFYSWILFVFDILILLLLFISYKSLMAGLKFSNTIGTFFMCLASIHAIFFIWDVFLIPMEKQSTRIKVYDLIGFLLFVFGFYAFSQRPIAGVCFLWLFTIAYILICYKDISTLLNVEN